MNGRFFDGRQLTAEFYDGYTDYYVPEKEEDRIARDKEWEKFLLEQEDSESNASGK